jgi:hypothetical protein
MGSFGLAEFGEVGDNDGSFYSFASSVQGRRLAVPGGDRIVVQRNYQATHLITTPALCSYAELEALRGKVGTSDMLTLGLMGGAAYLLAVAPVRVHDSSCYLVDLSWRYHGAINEGGQTGGGYGSTYGSNRDGM